MAISFVSAQEAHTETNGTSFSCSKPSGVAAGDVMVMVWATTTATYSSATVTAPSGWTKIRTSQDGTNEVLQCVMMKIVDGSEGSSFSVSQSQTFDMCYIGIAAYRGATGDLIVENANTETVSSSPLATPTVNNTQSTAWRICIGNACSTTGTGTPQFNETSRRLGGTSWKLDGDGGTFYHCLQLWDSNAAIATGNTSKSFSASGTTDWSAVSWIGILEQGSAVTASGSLAMTLGGVEVASDGSVHDDGTMAATLGGVTMAMSGEGAPVPASGDMAMTLAPVQMDGAAGVPPMGDMSITLSSVMAFEGETRLFGIRVILVDADVRTIIVPSRGVDD